LRACPRVLRPALSGAIAVTWYCVFPLRRRTVVENLALAFPEKGPLWRLRTAIRCARHFVSAAFDIASLDKAEEEDYRRMLQGIEGREHLEAVGEGGKPVICVAGHLGNWELLVSLFTMIKKVPLAVLVKPLHNPLVEGMVTKRRQRYGFEIIHTGRDMREALRAVRANKFLGFLADQDAGRRGIFVPFFNVPASTFQGPAVFSYRLNLPILVVTCRRVSSEGRYVIRLHPPIYPNPQANRQEEIERLTRLHVRHLESAIREAPEQYFWFHKRWKTRPRKPRTNSLDSAGSR